MNVVIPGGAWPILFTPFKTDGTIDFAVLDQLIDFYVQVRVPGLFALGQASEVLALSDDERFAVAQRVAAQCKGRLLTVAVGNFGSTLDEQAESLTKLVDLGIDVGLIAISLLPSAQNLGDQLLQLADTIDPSIPLGVYELPEPEHRLLTAQEVRRIARTGRFVFMKDTCRQIEPFTAKVAAATGTNLKIFQANLKILPPSMDIGSHGFCGWMPMVAPELSSQVCAVDVLAPEVRDRAYRKLMEFQTVLVEYGFPASGKYALSKRGVPLTTECRVKSAERFTPQTMVELDRWLSEDDRFAPIVAS